MPYDLYHPLPRYVPPTVTTSTTRSDISIRDFMIIVLWCQMGEQSLDRLLHLLRRRHPESLSILCGGGHAGCHHPHGGVEVSLLPQDRHPAALQHLRLPRLAGTGVVARRWPFHSASEHFCNRPYLFVIPTQYKDGIRPRKLNLNTTLSLNWLKFFFRETL